ncbi:MAG: hypothetical protein KDA78_03720 [Planctomycetaceae bacterium]|nr:hypothetical protein [Planctomycetaceae bacterium]
MFTAPRFPLVCLATLLLSVVLPGALNRVCLAESGWPVEYQQGNIRIYSQVSAEKIAPPVKELADFQRYLAMALQLTLNDHPVDLVVFSSMHEYRSYIRPRHPEAISRPALFVKSNGTLTVYVVYGNDFVRNLKHEFTHATLHGSLPYLPIWVDEGLAEFFEVPQDQLGYQAHYHDNLNWRLRFRHKVRTTELENLQGLEEMRPEHYRDCWAWIYFCLHESPESRNLLREYLGQIQEEEVVGSLLARIEQALPNSQDRIEQFYRNLK